MEKIYKNLFWENSENKSQKTKYKMEQLNSNEIFGENITSFNLFHTQATAVQWMKYVESKIFEEGEIPGGILADAPGHGKTKVIAALIEVHLVDSTLFFGPLSTLHQPIKEFLETSKRLNVYTITNSELLKASFSVNNKVIYSQRTTLEKPFVLVINKEKLNSETSFSIINNETYFRVILDEAHTVRNGDSTQFFKKLCSIRHPKISISGVKRDYVSRFAMTGTPIQNSYDDLINIFKWIDPFVFANKNVKYEELRLRIRKSLFRRVDDNLTPYMKKIMNFPVHEPQFIPPIKPYVEKTSFSKKLETLQPDRIKELCERDSIFREKLSKDERAFTIATSIMLKGKERTNSESSTFAIQSILSYPLKDPVCGVKYVGEPYSKIVSVFEIIEERLNQSFIIFHLYTPIKDILMEYLPQLEGYTIFSISGKTTVKKRVSILEECNNLISNNKPVILLLSLLAANEGLNCQYFYNTIYLDNHSNPQIKNQADRRTYRVGQEKQVFIWSIISDEILNANKIIDVDKRLELIKNEKLPFLEIADTYNAAWFFRRYTFLNDNNVRETGVVFSDEFESSRDHDTVGFLSIS